MKEKKPNKIEVPRSDVKRIGEGKTKRFKTNEKGLTVIVFDKNDKIKKGDEIVLKFKS